MLCLLRDQQPYPLHCCAVALCNISCAKRTLQVCRRPRRSVARLLTQPVPTCDAWVSRAPHSPWTMTRARMLTNEEPSAAAASSCFPKCPTKASEMMLIAYDATRFSSRGQAILLCCIMPCRRSGNRGAGGHAGRRGCRTCNAKAPLQSLLVCCVQACGVPYALLPAFH